MEQQAKKLNKANRRLVFNIIPAFLIVFVFFFVLTRSKIIDLSKDKFIIESENYADKVSFWAEEILSSLSVYKDYADKIGIDDPQTFALFDTSYENTGRSRTVFIGEISRAIITTRPAGNRMTIMW